LIVFNIEYLNTKDEDKKQFIELPGYYDNLIVEEKKSDELRTNMFEENEFDVEQ